MDNINRNEPDLTLDNEQKHEAENESRDLQFLGDPNAALEQAKKEKTKKSILKRFAPILALCGVAVILFVSVVVLKHIVPDNKQEITTEEKKTGIELIDESGASGEKLEIKNQLDEYTFVRRLEKTYYIVYKGLMQLDEKEELPMNIIEALNEDLESSTHHLRNMSLFLVLSEVVKFLVNISCMILLIKLIMNLILGV